MTQDSSTASGKLSSSNMADETIAPKLRRRLQECYEQGTALVTKDKYDFDYVHSFFVQCVLRDPENLLYLEAFLENLHRKYNNNKRGSRLNFGGKGALKKAVAKEDWDEVFKLAIEALKSNPWDVQALRAAADACAEFGCSQTELRYLKNALVPNPQDPVVNRHCALSLARVGQFDQAITCWTRVDDARRGDEEAQKKISELQIAKTVGKAAAEDNRPSARRKAKREAEAKAAEAAPERREIKLTRRQELEQLVSMGPTDGAPYFELAEIHVAENRLSEAAQTINKAIAASGGSLQARERLEDIEVLRKQEQITIAEQRAAGTDDDEAQQLVVQLRDDLNRYEIEVFNGRSERYPDDLEAKYQLGVRLRRAGNFREAIPILADAAKLESRQAVALLELGECLQRTKQYDKALECYVRSVDAAVATEGVEIQKLARYRTAVLAAGLHNNDLAEQQFTAVIAIDADYKDVALRLDKIREIRDKS